MTGKFDLRWERQDIIIIIWGTVCRQV